jgi:hypothetical protein
MPIDPSSFGGGPAATATPNYTGIWDGCPFALDILSDHTSGSAFSIVVEARDAIVIGWLSTYTAGATASDSSKVSASLSILNRDGTYAVPSDEGPAIQLLPLIVGADLQTLGISIPAGLGFSDAGGYDVTVWIVKTVSGVLLDRWALAGKLVINIAGAPAPS